MALGLAPITGVPHGPGADGAGTNGAGTHPAGAGTEPAGAGRAGPGGPWAVAARTPVGIPVAWGSVLIVVVACAAAVLPVADRGWRFAVIMAAVAAFAAIAGNARAVAMVAGIGWLVYTGFLLDSLGVLSWHGPGDLWRALLLAAAGAAGLAAGAGYRWLAARRGARAARSGTPVVKITVLPRTG